MFLLPWRVYVSVAMASIGLCCYGMYMFVLHWRVYVCVVMACICLCCHGMYMFFLPWCVVVSVAMTCICFCCHGMYMFLLPWGVYVVVAMACICFCCRGMYMFVLPWHVSVFVHMSHDVYRILLQAFHAGKLFCHQSNMQWLVTKNKKFMLKVKVHDKNTKNTCIALTKNTKFDRIFVGVKESLYKN